jgi:hypothetical protein
MWQFTTEQDEAAPAQRAEEDRGAGSSTQHTAAAPRVAPREETLLGILLRLPAPWIR